MIAQTIGIIAMALFGIHYFMLGAYAGAILNVLSFVIAVYFSGDGLLAILPLAGCIFLSIGLYIDDESKAQRFIVCSSPCWLIYNAINMSIGGVIAEIINVCSLVSAFMRFDTKRS